MIINYSDFVAGTLIKGKYFAFISEEDLMTHKKDDYQILLLRLWQLNSLTKSKYSIIYVEGIGEMSVKDGLDYFLNLRNELKKGVGFDETYDKMYYIEEESEIPETAIEGLLKRVGER